MKEYNIGIIGATGMVGKKFISLLKDHPWFKIKVLAASKRSSGKKYREVMSEKSIEIEDIPEEICDMIVYDALADAKKIVSMVDFVFCAVNMDKTKTCELEEMYARLECPVISNNSANRLKDDIPMMIPEINPEHSDIIPVQRKRLGTKKGFIAVKSNCSIQCFVPALHPLFDLGIKNILACTYQAVSGAGKTLKTWPEMVDNIIPYISGEEEKSEIEPLKIWGSIENDKIKLNNDIKITTQCIRVPVSDGHTAAVFASFDKKIDMEDIIYRWDSFKSIAQELDLPSAPKKFIHYFNDDSRPQIKTERNLENGMAISVGRLRQDNQYDIKFVSMSHNTVRGAAGGAILMAELLCIQNYI